jgi:hypothetical protein
LNIAIDRARTIGIQKDWSELVEYVGTECQTSANNILNVFVLRH